MKAYILINTRVGQVGDVVNHLNRIEAVKEATMTFGPYDVVAVVESENVDAVGRILANEIQPIPGVTETLTCLGVNL